MQKNVYYRNFKLMFEDLLPCCCCATRRTIRQQVSQPASAGKEADMSVLQSHHCMFAQIDHTRHEPSYMATPNCLQSVGSQIISVLMFLTGAAVKLKRGHMKCHAVAVSVQGASRSQLSPWPLIRSFKSWLRNNLPLVDFSNWTGLCVYFCTGCLINSSVYPCSKFKCNMHLRTV